MQKCVVIKSKSTQIKHTTTRILLTYRGDHISKDFGAFGRCRFPTVLHRVEKKKENTSMVQSLLYIKGQKIMSGFYTENGEHKCTQNAGYQPLKDIEGH